MANNTFRKRIDVGLQDSSRELLKEILPGMKGSIRVSLKLLAANCIKSDEGRPAGAHRKQKCRYIERGLAIRVPVNKDGSCIFDETEKSVEGHERRRSELGKYSLQ